MDLFPFTTANVVSFSGNYIPDTTYRIAYISLITRDQVNMNMHDSLSAGETNIDTDIKAIGGKTFLNQRADFSENLMNRQDFVFSQVAVISHMAARYN